MSIETAFVGHWDAPMHRHRHDYRPLTGSEHLGNTIGGAFAEPEWRAREAKQCIREMEWLGRLYRGRRGK